MIKVAVCTLKKVVEPDITLELKIYQVLVDEKNIEYFFIASNSIDSAMEAARRFGFNPISAMIMPE